MIIRKNKKIMILLAVLMIFQAFAGPVRRVSAEDIPLYTASDISTAPDYIREQLKAHNDSVTIKYKVDKKIEITEDEYNGICNAGDAATQGACINAILDAKFPEKAEGWNILSKAVAHNGNGIEGDYLINNLSGEYGCSFAIPEGMLSLSSSDGAYYLEIDTVTYKYSFGYYTTQEQENTFISTADSVMSSLGLSSMSSDYDKVCAIYSYIADNVTYDKEHLNDPNYMLKQSAYAALINKTAVCQGYASLFYYMANNAGLDCRIIKGDSKNFEGNWEHHAWNLVKLDGKYYFVDVTWDSGREPYEYFLEGSNSTRFKEDHTIFGLDKVSSSDEYEDLSTYDVSTDSYYSGKKLTRITSAIVNVQNAIYDNGKCSADITVTLGGKTLRKNLDYKVEFTEFKAAEGSAVGNGYLTITGIGMYEASLGGIVCVMTDVNAAEEATTENDTTQPEVPEEQEAQSQDKSGDEKASGKDAGKEKASADGDNTVYAEFNETIEKGFTLKIGSNRYKVTKAGDGGTLSFSGTVNKVGSAVVPDIVNIDGVDYKVDAIEERAFKGNTKLKTVTIGKNVTKIGKKAFYGCKKLGTINIRAKKIKSVGNDAFKNIKTKTKVVVPKGSMTKYKKLLRKKGISNKAKFVTAK
jgi:hypothetical protein